MGAERRVSAQVTALEIERPDGQTQKMIVRQHGAVDLPQNPQIAADEFKLLQIPQSAGLATPAPYYVDQSGNIFPTPYVVIEYIEGRDGIRARLCSRFYPAVRHASGPNSCCRLLKASDLSFLPKQEQKYTGKVSERPPNLDESIDEGRIRDMLNQPGHYRSTMHLVLLHGDFWPGNLLWKDGRLVAVIDWEDAALGDPLADLANSRLESLVGFRDRRNA